MPDGFPPEWPEPLLCGGFCGRGRRREWVAIHRERQELPEGDGLIEGSVVRGAARAVRGCSGGILDDTERPHLRS